MVAAGTWNAEPGTSSEIERRAVVASWVYGLTVAAGLGHFLLGIPIQFTDSYGNMLKLVTPWRELIAREFFQNSYLRPFLFAELKIIYDLSGGRYYEWYRGTHVLQVFGLVALYLMLVKPRTWRDAAIVPLGLAILAGGHTFVGTVNEAFPVNTFMTVLLCCLAAANLSMTRHRWWNDVLAVALFAIAALTVESGLLVWVIVVAAALVGARGVSRAGLAAMTLLLAGYFFLRFAYLHVGTPGLIERSSGFGFGRLEPSQLIAIFGSSPLGFYAYNVLASALSVLFAEPSDGMFAFVAALMNGTPTLPHIVSVVASTGTTVVLAAFAWQRRAAWRARRFDDDDRLVLIFAAVLIANATLSYAYTKDVIVSPAGVFFAVAAFAALRGLSREWPLRLAPARSAAVIACCAVLASAWALRVARTHVLLRIEAGKVRTEWSYVDDKRASDPGSSDRALRLLRDLRNDAIYVRPLPRSLEIANNAWLKVD